MTLEEAMQNAQAYAQIHEQEKTKLPIIEKQYGRGSRQWKMCYKTMNDAKAMLEWYQGDKGNAGMIGKLASEATQLKESSNLGERFKGRIFGNFDKSRDPQAFNQCANYANWDLFHMERNSLIILGKIGSGKTHLAGAISNVLIDRGIPVLFGTLSEHLEKIRQEFNSSGDRVYLAKMKTIPVLVIDDIGREKETDWTRQILFDTINFRYEHMTPTIITANLDIDTFANRLGDDIFSRIYEMSYMVETTADDYRQR